MSTNTTKKCRVSRWHVHVRQNPHGGRLLGKKSREFADGDGFRWEVARGGLLPYKNSRAFPCWLRAGSTTKTPNSVSHECRMQ